VLTPARQRLRTLALAQRRSTADEAELRALVAAEGYPAGPKEPLDLVVRCAEGIVAADIVLQEAEARARANGRRSIIPPKRERLAVLLAKRHKGTATTVEELELRHLVAQAGYPEDARTMDLAHLERLGYGIVLADILVGEA
jgi:hypothetical protein